MDTEHHMNCFMAQGLAAFENGGASLYRFLPLLGKDLLDLAYLTRVNF
jgi:hypothetical protein